MMRLILVASLAVGLLAIPGGTAARPQAVGAPPTADTAETIVATLHNSRVSYEKDLQTTPFKEVMEDFAKLYSFPIIVNKKELSQFGDDNIGTMKAQALSIGNLNGINLHRFLIVYLSAMHRDNDEKGNWTYLVRDDYIEITTREAARKEAGLLEAVQEASGDTADLVRAKARLNLQLVCVAVKDQALSPVLYDLSRTYGVNVVVDSTVRPQVDKTHVTERLLNVPADTALELLAAQAGLEVVRKGNTFRITQ
jgi:hypothetical protein